MEKNTKYGLRKNKAVKTLCGTAIAISMFGGTAYADTLTATNVVTGTNNVETVVVPETGATETPVTPVEEAPVVTKEQLDTAKANLADANAQVTAQEAVVSDAQAQQAEAQANLDKAVVENATAQTNAEQATPEAIKSQETVVANAEQNVAVAEQNVADAQAQTTQPKIEVDAQKVTVAIDQKAVDTKTQEVSDAQKAVSDAQKAIDTTQTPSISVADAQKAVDTAQTTLDNANSQLPQAQQADAQLIQKIKDADAVLQSNNATLAQKQTALNNIVNAIKAEQVTVAPNAVGYYNQNDPRWGWMYYGAWSMGVSGCAPTSMAMVFSELLGRTILPTDVATYLYNSTSYFNKSVIGTSGKGVLNASAHYGLVATSMANQNELITALKAGHFVLGAVGNNKFTPYGGTHELVLKGYSNGNTFAYDPYTRSNIGWYPVSSLWAEQSWDKDDRAGLASPFVKIVTQQMANLEAQKETARNEVAIAQNAVNTAQATLNSLKSTPLQTPAVQAKIVSAEQALKDAKATYDNAVIAEQTASKDLATKQAELNIAKNLLITKQGELATSQDKLTEAKTILEALQAKLDMAVQNVVSKQQALAQTRVELNNEKAKLVSLSTASETYKETQAKVSQLRTVLAEKVALTNEALDKLEALKLNRDDIQSIYDILKANYVEPVVDVPVVDVPVVDVPVVTGEVGKEDIKTEPVKLGNNIHEKDKKALISPVEILEKLFESVEPVIVKADEKKSSIGKVSDVIIPETGSSYKKESGSSIDLNRDAKKTQTTEKSKKVQVLSRVEKRSEEHKTNSVYGFLALIATAILGGLGYLLKTRK